MYGLGFIRRKCFTWTCGQSYRGACWSALCRQAFGELPLPGAASRICEGLCPEGIGEASRPSPGLEEVKISPLRSQGVWTPVQAPSLISGQYCPQMSSSRDWRPPLCQKGSFLAHRAVSWQSLASHLRKPWSTHFCTHP